MDARQSKITKVTLVGTAVNVVLTAGKIAAGIVGRSSAMVSDGIHSLSDLVSDIVVLIFVHISSQGKDESHDFGHGKFETFATLMVALLLLLVAGKMIISGIEDIISVINGGIIAVPTAIALWAAVASIVAKEALYHYTVYVGKKVDSPVVVANAWHHRSDAFSSIGSLIGIGGAMLLGNKFTILDPIAGCIIAIMIIISAIQIAMPAIGELLDVSLPKEMEDEIVTIAESVQGVHNIHELKTHRNGPSIIIEAHLVVDPHLTVVEAHDICTEVENALISHFGQETQISIHIEPDTDA